MMTGYLHLLEDEKGGNAKGGTVKQPKIQIPPPLAEVTQQFSINKPGHWTIPHMDKEAQGWYDYYQSNGWMVGKTKMKDWKASIRTWIRNDYNFNKTGNGTTKYLTKQQQNSAANADQLRRILAGDL